MKLKFTFLLSGFLFSVLGYAGGQDLGGGGTSDVVRPTENMLLETLSRYHSKRYELMNFIRLAGLVSHRILNVEHQMSHPLAQIEKEQHILQSHLYHRIFSSQEVFDQLVNVKLIFSNSCLDLAGQDRDATAGVVGRSVICWNVPRLLSKLTTQNYELELLALYAHEFSHLYGTSEEEAIQLQNKIIGIGPNFKRYLGFFFPTERSISEELSSVLEVAMYLRNSRDLTKMDVCGPLYEIQRKMLSLYRLNSVETANVASVSFEQVIAFHAAFVHSQYLVDYCDQFSSLRHQAKFATGTPAPLASLYPDPILILSFLGPDQSLQYSQYILADLSEAKISWISYGDLQGLNQNLDQLISLLQAFKK